MKTSAFTTRKALAAALREHHTGTRSWPATGREFGISGGMAYRVALQEYEPKDAAIRARLRLPVFVDVPVCPVHGVAHVSKRCPSTRTAYPDLFAWPVQVLAQAIRSAQH